MRRDDNTSCERYIFCFTLVQYIQSFADNKYVLRWILLTGCDMDPVSIYGRYFKVCGFPAVVRPWYLYYWNVFTAKTAFWYWDDPMVTVSYMVVTLRNDILTSLGLNALCHVTQCTNALWIQNITRGSRRVTPVCLSPHQNEFVIFHHLS